jgi:hypothetical protein
LASGTTEQIGYGNAWIFLIKLSENLREVSLGKETMKGHLQEYRDGISKLARSPGIDSKKMDSASLCSLAGRYDKPNSFFFSKTNLF